MNDKNTEISTAAPGAIDQIYKRIEAITGALFLVTNLMPDSDILKKTLREQALSNLSKAVSLRNASVNVNLLQEISATLNHIHSLLDIAFWSGLITQMN